MKVNCLKYVLTLSVSLFCFSVFSQTELKNKIVDFGTLLPIESASIYVKNTTIGTLSNSDGKFVLLVPNEFKNDTLIISSIGYKSFKTPVNEFDNSLEIYLELSYFLFSLILAIVSSFCFKSSSCNEIS